MACQATATSSGGPTSRGYGEENVTCRGVDDASRKPCRNPILSIARRQQQFGVEQTRNTQRDSKARIWTCVSKTRDCVEPDVFSNPSLNQYIMLLRMCF